MDQNNPINLDSSYKMDQSSHQSKSYMLDQNNPIDLDLSQETDQNNPNNVEPSYKKKNKTINLDLSH